MKNDPEKNQVGIWNIKKINMKFNSICWNICVCIYGPGAIDTLVKTLIIWSCAHCKCEVSLMPIPTSQAPTLLGLLFWLFFFFFFFFLRGKLILSSSITAHSFLWYSLGATDLSAVYSSQSVIPLFSVPAYAITKTFPYSFQLYQT